MKYCRTQQGPTKNKIELEIEIALKADMKHLKVQTDTGVKLNINLRDKVRSYKGAES